jgi:hypothetical protein
VTGLEFKATDGTAKLDELSELATRIGQQAL